MWIFYDLFCHNFFFVRRYFHHLSFQEFRSAFCGAWCCPGKFRDQLADCAELESTLLQFFYIHKKLNIISGVIAMTKFVPVDPQFQFFFPVPQDIRLHSGHLHCLSDGIPRFHGGAPPYEIHHLSL